MSAARVAAEAPRVALRIAVALTAGLVVVRLVGGTWLPWPGPSVLAFTPYGIPVAVGLALLALALRRWPDALVAAGALVALLVLVVPRTVAREQPTLARPSDREMRVMTANVLRSHADPGELVALVRRRRPDVLSLQEATPAFVAALRRAGIDEVLPHRVVLSGRRLHDTGVLSRWPVERAATTLPSVFLQVRVALPGGPPVTVVSAHPTPPVKPGSQGPWRGWLGELPGPRELPGPAPIVAGDFNATLDHGELRRILGSGWRDAAREAGQGLVPTWHGLPGARLTLDHVLVAPGTAVGSARVDPLGGSDHRALTATLTLPPQ